MTPSDPPPPSEGIPRPIDSGSVSSGPSTGPLPGISRSKRETWFGDGGPARKFLQRWGFPLFLLFVLVLGRAVLLPFVFASLIAYILAPIVRRMSERQNGTRRMPRGLAIIVCYIVFLAGVTGFMFLLIPRLSGDIKRLSDEVSFKRINEEWTPEVAHWLEKRFPSLASVKAESAKPPQPAVPEMPLPPGTAFTLTPLPDGSYAAQLTPSGFDIKATPDGGYHVQALESAPEPLTFEDKLRSYVNNAMAGLKSKMSDALVVLQNVVTEFIRGIFMFFFTLMIGAFILIDVEKVHAFLRSLFPPNTREGYDIIVAGIDRGLSGVIRGQLLICVINACLTYVGLLVFGIKYKLILSIVAGLMSLIPIFGSILSSIPIVIVALVSGDEGIDIFRGIAMVLWIVGIHFIEANVLNPKIIGTAAKIHPVLVIFALFLGEHSYGLVGALLAVPLLSAIQVIFMYFYRKRWKDAQRPITGPVARVEPGPLPPTVK